jgi:hypothetical protein
MNLEKTSPGLIPPHGFYRRLKSLQIDALGDVLYLPSPRLRQAGALTPAEIKIVESHDNS